MVAAVVVGAVKPSQPPLLFASTQLVVAAVVPGVSIVVVVRFVLAVDESSSSSFDFTSSWFNRSSSYIRSLGSIFRLVYAIRDREREIDLITVSGL